jgi:hypothetical protein
MEINKQMLTFDMKEEIAQMHNYKKKDFFYRTQLKAKSEGKSFLSSLL